LLESFSTGSPILAHGIRAHEFLLSPLGGRRPLVSLTSVPLQVANRVIGMLNVFSFTRGKKIDEGARKMLSVLASRAAATIENARLYEALLVKKDKLEQANQSLEDNFQHTIVGFAQALEESDPYTRGHSERVGGYAELAAKGLTLPDRQVRTALQAGLMHDIGKIGIRHDTLNKPGKLSPHEIKRFREHPEKGRRILEPIPCMHELIDAAWCHHERFDGDGYPRGLRAEEIPLLGRIMAIADAYDAMTSDRAYRRALMHRDAVQEIERCVGTQFDPEIAKAFLSELKAFRAGKEKRKEGSLLPP